MEWLRDLASDWGPWLAVFTGLGGLVAWSVGLPAILNIFSKLIDVASPVLKVVSEGIAAAAKWVWTMVLWPGIKDIFDSWTTIATVAAMCLMLYGWMDRKVDHAVEDLAMCQTEVSRLKRTGKVPAPEWSLDKLLGW